MLIVCFALLLGTLGGGLAGVLMSWWLLTRRFSGAPPAADLGLDPDLDEKIRRAASDWAEAHDRPEVSALVADKLRLVYLLGQRRHNRKGRSAW